MVKKASPRPGRDGNGPAPDDIMDALATEVLQQENMKLLREQRKRARATAEGKGINLGQLDELYRRRDDTAGDIEGYFKGLFQTFGAYFQEFTEMDFFVRKTTKTEKAAFGHAGLMAGLKGEDPTVPQNLVGQEIQDWEGGYRKGIDARNRNKRTLADTLAAALAQPEGTVLDGKTGKPVKPLTKKEQKAADLAAAAKQPDLEAQAKAPAEGGEGASVKLADQPDWSGFDDDPLKWGPEQSRGFSEWHDALPAKVSVQIAHPGILKAFRARRGEGAPAAETFEASPEEIAAQAGRPGGATDMVDDDYTVGGIRYPSKVAAKAARGLLESQSAKAARLRDEANVP